MTKREPHVQAKLDYLFDLRRISLSRGMNYAALLEVLKDFTQEIAEAEVLQHLRAARPDQPEIRVGDTIAFDDIMQQPGRAIYVSVAYVWHDERGVLVRVDGFECDQHGKVPPKAIGWQIPLKHMGGRNLRVV